MDFFWLNTSSNADWENSYTDSVINNSNYDNLTLRALAEVMSYFQGLCFGLKPQQLSVKQYPSPLRSVQDGELTQICFFVFFSFYRISLLAA